MVEHATKILRQQRAAVRHLKDIAEHGERLAQLDTQHFSAYAVAKEMAWDAMKLMKSPMLMPFAKASDVVCIWVRDCQHSTPPVLYRAHGKGEAAANVLLDLYQQQRAR